MTFKRKVAYVVNSEEIQDGMSGYRFRDRSPALEPVGEDSGGQSYGSSQGKVIIALNLALFGSKAFGKHLNKESLLGST